MTRKEQEKRVRKAVAALGLETRRGVYWSYIPDDLTIKEVWRGKATDGWLWSMLHEVGHHLLHRKRDYGKRFWRTSQTMAHVVDGVSGVQIMKEEILAWEEGLKWAAKIGVPVDRKRYDKYASRYLLMYMREIPTAAKNNSWMKSFFDQ